MRRAIHALKRRYLHGGRGRPRVPLCGTSSGRPLLFATQERVVDCLKCLKRLGRRMFVKALEVPDGKQPDMLSREEIVLLLMKGKAST